MSPKPFCFVLMPFDEKYNDIYRFGIKNTAEQEGYHTERVDEQFYIESMLEQIYQQIEKADLIIADMTGKNPNVFYEVGYAHAKNKECILLTQSPDDIPFDLKHHFHVIYDGTASNLNAKLKPHVASRFKTKAEKKIDTVKITASNLGGYLEISDFAHTCSFTLQLNVKNPSTKAYSPTIDAIYLTNSPRWTLQVNGKPCDYEVVEGGLRRHLIIPKLPRLSPGAFLKEDIKFNRYIFDSDEKAMTQIKSSMKDKDDEASLSIQGYLDIQAVTEEGNVDLRHQLDITFRTFPF